jgi:hypothetical protein
VKLRATVRTVTGHTKHHSAAVTEGEVINMEELPHPAYLEISKGVDGAFYLYRFTDAGRCITDTWHMTIEEAKEQAFEEFRIAPADWALVDEKE